MAKGSLYLCDLICYGVPSQKVFSEFIQYVEKTTDKKVKSYEFRVKNDRNPEGGPRITFSDGSIEQNTHLSDLWSHLWPDCLLRPSCYKCGYHSLSRPGDITLGDFWGFEDFYPDLPNYFGTSCLMANTEKGMNLFKEIENEIDCIQCDLESIANPKQPMLKHPPNPTSKRDSFLDSYIYGGFEDACRAIKMIEEPSKLRSFKRFVKNLISAFKHYLLHMHQGKSSSRNDLWENSISTKCENATNFNFPIGFAARAKYLNDRIESSSGGLANKLAEWFVENSGYVYGCSMDENHLIRHIKCESLSEINKLRGSKYVQSDLNEVLDCVKNDLESGHDVLFFGTPCQVDAVKTRLDIKSTKDNEMRDIPVLYGSSNECCGCTLCSSVCPVNAITFKSDIFGFNYPCIDESTCIKCHLCKENCQFQKRYLR